MKRLLQSKKSLKKIITKYWALILAVSVYSYLAYRLKIIQDDAYISYRYIANFLNGDGLVYNIGEHIEGFTNFGWVIYLTLFGTLGIDYILVSEITGYLFGAGIVIMTFLLAELVFEKSRLLPALATILVAANMSLAHWSPAGLETAAFAFFAMLSLYLYVKRSWWLIFSLLLIVWIRPDGVVIAGMLIIIEAAFTKRFPKYTVTSNGIAFVFSIPYLVFKYFYYGSIIPNPFYAKTGFNLDQLYNGFEYTGRFMSHYGFYGLIFLIPLLFYRRLSLISKVVWWSGVLFTCYVTFIGGDVLKVHRFYLPIFGTTAILSILSLNLLAEKFLAYKFRAFATVTVAAGLIALTFYLPDHFVTYYNSYEKGFTRKMKVKAQDMKAADTTNFSVALPTIGIFGYELIGHRIVDMVGLTDSTIARHPEEPIPGMKSTWKEVRHNSEYLLSSNLDYIIFSTDLKPSAPAERALLLYPQFINDYRTIGWHFKRNETDAEGTLIIAYKRMRPIEGPFIPTYPVEWVEYYKQGLDAYGRGDLKGCISLLEKAIRASPQPYYPYAIYQMAYCNMRLNNHDRAVRLNDLVLQMDSVVYEAHKDLYIYSRFVNDSAKAEIHKRWLQKLVPWYWPRLKSLVDEQIILSGQKVQ